MNIKREVVDRIKDKLEKEQQKLRYKCDKNKQAIKNMVSEQEVMKREIAALGKMIKDLG
jgi:hypothetical protein